MGDATGAQITFNPDPPVHNKDLVIGCTGGTYPKTIELTWDPPGTPPSVTLTAQNPTATIRVPTNAVALTAVDTGNEAPYRDVPVA